MKWITVWIKNFEDYIYTKLSQGNKSKKYQGVKKKKDDFEMSMLSCRICCNIMVHFIGVPLTH